VNFYDSAGYGLVQCHWSKPDFRPYHGPAIYCVTWQWQYMKWQHNHKSEKQTLVRTIVGRHAPTLNSNITPGVADYSSAKQSRPRHSSHHERCCLSTTQNAQLGRTII